MARINIDGINIHYETGESFEDSLPTVLMIHGAGQSAATWDYQLDFLRGYPKANFIIPDLPGHGKSEGGGFRTVNDYTVFVKSLISSLGLRNIIIVGHSMGGGAAMLYALEHPENVSACVLAGTGARLGVAEKTLETAKNNYELFCEVSPERTFAASSPQLLKDAFKEGLLNTDRNVCYWDLVACNEFNIMEDVNRVDVGTLIITGSEDILTPSKYGVYLHNNIKGSIYKEIEGAGHFMMQEKHEEFNSLLVDFLINLT